MVGTLYLPPSPDGLEMAPPRDTLSDLRGPMNPSVLQTDSPRERTVC